MSSERAQDVQAVPCSGNNRGFAENGVPLEVVADRLARWVTSSGMQVVRSPLPMLGALQQWSSRRVCNRLPRLRPFCNRLHNGTCPFACVPRKDIHAELQGRG